MGSLSCLPLSPLDLAQLLLTLRSQAGSNRDRIQHDKLRKLKLSALSAHWLLQNPTVATVALAHWPLWQRGRAFRGKSQISRE